MCKYPNYLNKKLKFGTVKYNKLCLAHKNFQTGHEGRLCGRNLLGKDILQVLILYWKSINMRECIK